MTWTTQATRLLHAAANELSWEQFHAVLTESQIAADRHNSTVVREVAVREAMAKVRG